MLFTIKNFYAYIVLLYVLALCLSYGAEKFRKKKSLYYFYFSFLLSLLLLNAVAGAPNMNRFFDQVEGEGSFVGIFVLLGFYGSILLNLVLYPLAITLLKKRNRWLYHWPAQAALFLLTQIIATTATILYLHYS